MNISVLFFESMSYYWLKICKRNVNYFQYTKANANAFSHLMT